MAFSGFRNGITPHGDKIEDPRGQSPPATNLTNKGWKLVVTLPSCLGSLWDSCEVWPAQSLKGFPKGLRVSRPSVTNPPLAFLSVLDHLLPPSPRFLGLPPRWFAFKSLSPYHLVEKPNLKCVLANIEMVIRAYFIGLLGNSIVFERFGHRAGPRVLGKKTKQRILLFFLVTSSSLLSSSCCLSSPLS